MRYCAFPNYKRAKYFFSCDHYNVFKKGLFFYPSFSLEAKIKQTILKFLYPILNIKELITLDELLRELKLTEIYEHTAKYGEWINLYRPSKNKIIVQLFNKKREELFYLKIGLTGAGKKQVYHEKEVIDFLDRKSPKKFEFPRLIDYYESIPNNAIILTSLHSLEYPKSFSTLEIIPIVKEIYELDKRKMDSDYRKFFLGTIKKSKYARILYPVAEDIFRNISKEKVYIGFYHGDFKSWNILRNLNTGKFFIIDWEFANTIGMPLWDVFSFILQPVILLKPYWSYKKIYKYLIKNILFVSLNGETSMSLEMMMNFLILYLCYTIAFFSAYENEDKITQKSIVKMLRILELCVEKKY